MELIDDLPNYAQINVEWPPSFYAWQTSTDVAAQALTNYLVSPSNYYPITPGAKPFTLCAAPAAMKMLGLSPLFAKSGHTIDYINSPQNNMNITRAGTDGAIVIPDVTNTPQPYSPPVTWIYDSTTAAVIRTQLPKAYFERTLNFLLPQLTCADPTQCQFPRGMTTGYDLIGIFNHEINHILGVMQSQYYKVGGNQNALAYTYGTALFPIDLFDVDSDYVVPGYGHPGINTGVDFTAIPRNSNPYEPTTITDGLTPADLTPWVQFGLHDHVMVYKVVGGVPHLFPFMNYSLFNPDGDIQQQEGYITNAAGTVEHVAYVDPKLANLPEMNVVPYNVQAGGDETAILVDTIREYSKLAANGWNIDYSTLTDPYHTVSPLAKWYQTCFDSNGVFTVAKNRNCRFSVLPKDLLFLQ